MNKIQPSNKYKYDGVIVLEFENDIILENLKKEIFI